MRKVFKTIVSIILSLTFIFSYLNIMQDDVSAASAECEAYEENNSYVWGLPYHFDCDEHFFNVITSQPYDVNVSYQWYRIDSARKKSGNYDKDFDLYTKLNGQTASYFDYNQAARIALGEPYFDINGNETEIYYELACVVTFSRGSSIVEKTLNFKLNIHMGVELYAFNDANAHYTSAVTLPNAAKWVDDDVEIDGSFIEDDLPDGFSYRYTWYGCYSVPETNGMTWVDTGSQANISDVLGEVSYLGTGKEFNVNTRDVSLKYIDGEYLGYVACFVEPMYNGQRCYSNSFEVSLHVFELHYGSLKITKQTKAVKLLPGYSTYISCEAEGLFPSYQWQQLVDGEWVDLKYIGSKTKQIQVGVNESNAPKQYRCAVSDMLDVTIYTDPIVIDLYYGPSIFNQPVDFEGYAGDTAKFNVEAEGIGLTYQWQLKKGNSWADLSTGGAQTPELSVKIDESKNGKTYRCAVTASDGNTVYTDEVKIIVIKPKINISNQPKNFTGPEGSTAKFSVAADGEGLTYQWQLKKGSNWANLTSGGATTPNLSIKVDGSKNGKTYRCLIKNVFGEQLATDEVKITVKNPDIKINSQPSDYSGLEGSTANFTVAASGEGLTYQWQLKKGKSWADLSAGGAKTASMSIRVDASKNGKTYRCLITNAAGEQLATNEVTITVKQPSSAIAITKQPEDTEAPEGGTADFYVEAEGEGLTYQWQLRKGNTWANLTSGGANTCHLSLKKCDMSKNGKVYRCVITDANGEQVVSNEVALIIFTVVARSAEPAPASVTTTADVPVTSEPADEPANESTVPAEVPAAAPAEESIEVPAEEPA